MKYDFYNVPDRRGTQCVKWDEDPDPDMLPLWVADMDFRTAPAIIDALAERVLHGIFGYTHPGKPYHDAVTAWFERRHGWTINPEHIIYTTGVVPAISATIKGLAKPGDGVIVQTPVYTCFFSSIRNNGCRIVENKLIRTADSYRMDFDGLETLCANPANTLILLCNPHNPAGRVWTADELRHVDEIARRHGVTVISDEIHCELVYAPHVYTPYATVAQGPHVVFTSPSKAFNTAGLQTANIIAPDADMRARIDRAINDNEVCDIGPMGVTALIAAYNEGADWLDAAIDYIRQNYLYLCRRIAGMPVSMQVLDLQGTYLAWVDVSALAMPVEELSERLKHEAHIWFTPGTEYGTSGEGYLRINLATSRAILTEALDRLQAWLAAR